MDYDKTSIPETYNQGRDHGPAFLEQWMKVISSNVDERTVWSILDLGCGTGRFSQALAARFKATVSGIDPSIKMLGQARASLNRTDVFYASGRAEALPLRSNSVDMVFISMALHHFTDPPLAAQECARVLRPHGHLCLRTASREQIPGYAYVPFFPTSRVLLEERLPSIQRQRELFETASFRVLFSGLVIQQIAADHSDYADKIATKSDSILASLDEADFEAGLSAIRHHQASGPIVEPIDFLVFEKV